MVTWSALGLAALAVVAIVMIALGLLSTFAAGMSDAPVEGGGKGGCIAAAAGVALLAASVLGFVL